MTSMTLDRAALELARVEYPALDPEPWIQRLDAIAAEIGGKAPAAASGRAFVATANQVLFGALGLRGNEDDYYDIRNSCLNQVLERRLGIPITLSVVYLEVARRLSRPVYGIGLPTHFVIEYDDGAFATYIDPFHGGALMTREECAAMVEERTGRQPPPAAFVACDEKQIIARMLQNMKAVYVRSEQFEKALAVTDLIVAGGQFGPEEYKQRAVIQVQLQRYRAAMADLEQYLKLVPQATDRDEVVKHLEGIHRYLGSRN
jgi:regulator of sirC expression with transglutaminase-like and TPR domain